MPGFIVVGVDGSDASHEALSWAAKEAALRGVGLRAVHVWSYPYVADAAYLASATIDPGDLESAAKEILADAVATLPADTAVPIETVVVQGPAGPRLVQLAEDADLLVVGSRGRGGFAGLLLGSVGHQCVSHATCPVLVLPHHRKEG